MKRPAQGRNSTKRNFRMILPGGDGVDDEDQVAFTAFVESLKAEASVGDSIKASLNLKITGAPVWSTADKTLALSKVWRASGAQGATNLRVQVFGRFTGFRQGVTAITFSGTGITVNSSTVLTPQVAVADISISGGATLGARNVTATTGAEVVTKASGFTITA